MLKYCCAVIAIVREPVNNTRRFPDKVLPACVSESDDTSSPTTMSFNAIKRPKKRLGFGEGGGGPDYLQSAWIANENIISTSQVVGTVCGMTTTLKVC